jgi:hypothetical protein
MVEFVTVYTWCDNKDGTPHAEYVTAETVNDTFDAEDAARIHSLKMFQTVCIEEPFNGWVFISRINAREA